MSNGILDSLGGIDSSGCGPRAPARIRLPIPPTFGATDGVEGNGASSLSPTLGAGLLPIMARRLNLFGGVEVAGLNIVLSCLFVILALMDFGLHLVKLS
jgi:hypothetical protein